MKSRKPAKPEAAPSSGYHRNCHMAYIPPVIKVPKHEPAPVKKDHTNVRKSSCLHKQQRPQNEEELPPPSEKSVTNKSKEIISIFEHTPPTRVVECLVDNTYFNKPLIGEDISTDTNKASNPIKKIYFNIPEPKPSEEKPEKDVKTDVKNHPMDWNHYHRLSVIHKFMDDLESAFPSLCTTGVIGSSVEGRDLKILKISNSDAGNACVWIDAGIHAREWIAPAVNTYLANHITRNFDKLPNSITNKDWYFLPVINPDGYEYSHTTERMWRKNRAYVNGECVGVDLNRNFSFGWGGKGSSDNPTNAFYRGPQPFSEPESSAMREILSNSGINFKVYITLHSFGQVIIFPYACSSDLAPDYVRLLEGATAMSKAIYNTNGNIYKVGVSRDVMYGAAGTSNDFAHGVVGIPYCYLIELRSKKHKFKLPKEEIEETGNEILNCILALMEFVDTYPIDNSEDSESIEEFNRISGGGKVPFYQRLIHGSHSSMKKPSLEVIRKDYVAKKTSSSGGTNRTKNNDLNATEDQQDSKNESVQDNDSLLDGSSSSVRLRRHTHRSSSLVNAKDCNIDIDRMVSNTEWSFDDWTDDSYEKDSYEVFQEDSVQKTILIKEAINIWKEERSTMDIMIEGPRTAQIAGMLNEREIPFSIAVPDISALLEKEQGAAVTKGLRRSSATFRKHHSSSRTMDWKSYHRLDTIYAFMDNLAAEFPHLCSVSVIGKSVEGRDLKMLKISNGDQNNSGIWLDGAIHPREWISPAVVTYIADRIVRTFDEQPESVTNKDWYVLPVMNPDGYEYTHTHDRMWRKNRARYGECVGVDLNRNFSYGFGEKGEEGSSDDPGNIFYRGPDAFSEPETAAVRRAILEAPTTFKVFLSFHSYGEVIIFPWGYTSEPCPDYVELLEGGTAMAKAIFNTNGHTYKVGSTKDLMYYAAGTSIDWSYAVTNIPYSYMVELRGKQHRFLLPKEEIICTASEVLNGVLRLLDFVDRRCSGTQSCICPK